MRSNLRWCSDGFEITCWNGEIVRAAFIIDAHDREIIAWHAVVGSGISGGMVRDMMLEAVEKRCADLRAPQPIEWLTDNGSPYTARGYCQLGAKEAKLPRAQPSRQYTSAHEGNTSRIAPGEEGAITSSSVLTGRETMTAELEMIVDRSVGGEELLRMPG